jgi:hypothetical protein
MSSKSCSLGRELSIFYSQAPNDLAVSCEGAVRQPPRRPRREYKARRLAQIGALASCTAWLACPPVQPGYIGDRCPGTWLTLFLTPVGRKSDALAGDRSRA